MASVTSMGDRQPTPAPLFDHFFFQSSIIVEHSPSQPTWFSAKCLWLHPIAHKYGKHSPILSPTRLPMHWSNSRCPARWPLWCGAADSIGYTVSEAMAEATLELLCGIIREFSCSRVASEICRGGRLTGWKKWFSREESRRSSKDSSH